MKTKNTLKGFAVMLVLFVSTTAFGVPACPTPAVVRQPDGTMITIFLNGDEHFHWHTDTYGYPILKSAHTGEWVYASEVNGELVATGLVVGRVNPVLVGLPKADLVRVRAARPSRLLLGEPLFLQRVAVTGTMLNLVVLVNFSNLVITSTVQDFNDLFNESGYTTDGAVGSVRDYYDEVSYNMLAINSTVVQPVTLQNGYAYYGQNDIWGYDMRPREMVEEALQALEDRGFDFSAMDGDGDGWVDGLTIIHAGGGEEFSGNDPDYIWSHEWELSSTVTYDGVNMRMYHTEAARRGWDADPGTWGITRIGVICHENGHFLGLPDLYDRDGDSEGAGDFCLMAGGSWNGNHGTSPAHMSAWCKATLGWVTPTLIADSGTYSASQVETSPQIYKLQGGFSSNEYFLVENRQSTGFDVGLPGTQQGLLIWHVDENQAHNDDQNHYKVDLEEASGVQHLELNQNDGEDSDYYRADNARRFAAATTPDDLSYSGDALGLNISNVSASAPSISFTVSKADLWVDFGYSGPESGTFLQPYNTLAEAVTAAITGQTICIMPGSSPETLVISKEVTLEECGGIVTIGQ